MTLRLHCCRECVHVQTANIQTTGGSYLRVFYCSHPERYDYIVDPDVDKDEDECKQFEQRM